MLLAIGYHKGDVDQAERLAAWMQELGGLGGHRMLVARDQTTDAHPFAGIGFGSVEEFVVTDDAWTKWPESCNNVFKKVCKAVEYSGHPEPFLWLEPDVVPWREGWIDALMVEYNSGLHESKVFLGDFVSVHTPEHDVPDHMSGVGIYPGQMTAHAGIATMAIETAWDVFAAGAILPRMHKSELILHSWRHKAFTDWDMVEREILAFKPRIALYHADKTGSLYPLLREKRNPGSVSIVTQPPAPPSPPVVVKPAPTTDIFIKSYPPDYELLGYCLRSIEKFATGFRRVVIVIPKEEVTGQILDKVSLPVGTVVIQTVENGDGYLYQQAIKAGAHEFTDSDYILHIDSDTMLTAPVTPETFMEDGKPIWLMTPYSAIAAPWQPITEKFIGEPVEFEFMRRFPILVPRHLHLALSAFCMAKHGVRLTDYILSAGNREFSEFNALGALAYSRARNDFIWRNTITEPMPPLMALQRWSHDPITPEVREELEIILGTPEGSHLSSDRRAWIGNDWQEIVPPTTIRQTAAGLWVINGDTHISKWVEEKGQLQHDFQTLPLVLPEIKEGDVVVDVGANIGDTTGPFLDRVGQLGVVFAFEPHPDAFECLSRNCPRAHSKRYALGAYQDNVAMQPGANGNFGATFVTNKNGDEGGATVRTLDSFDLKHCDFIKIDVEGYELKVLQGAERTINRFRPKLMIEINEGALIRHHTGSAEVFLWLWSHGYLSYPLILTDLNQPSPQYDILCRPIQDWTPGQRDKEMAGPVKPWVSKLESIERVKALVRELKTFCNRPVYTNKVRLELKVAHVTAGLPRGRVPYHKRNHKPKVKKSEPVLS